MPPLILIAFLSAATVTISWMGFLLWSVVHAVMWVFT
ncbi:MAG: hypothetical protein JWN07_997 [Hyphomicrobiales bacterium]|nr:hypothetical protein [Hyphomicrobiales bacterium]